MDELKHSIKIYLLFFGDTTKMLASYLLKVIDLIEDKDEDRKELEAADISLSLIMNIAGLLIHNAADCIKWHKQEAFNMIRQHTHKATGSVEELEHAYYNLSRTYHRVDFLFKAKHCAENKGPRIRIIKKKELLVGMAFVLDKISALTGVTYPTIFTSDHERLNNLNITQEELESMKDHVVVPFSQKAWLGICEA